MSSLITKLYQSNKTILTNKDIALIWEETDTAKLASKIAYYVRTNQLTKLSRGIFAKYKKFNPLELATSIYIPSYISFETVLREHGLIFQHYDAIFVASKWSKIIYMSDCTINVRKMKDIVIYNATGIINTENYSIASLERAFLDMIYLFPNYYFDNLEPINWDKCDELVKIYGNKQLVKRLKIYRKKYAQ
ncbi:hypothetical protein KA017_01405 [Candidatus Woesebacteria bacterium]|nr:hypothetical protein [Candidatus Woesebacteria bacterium]